MKIFGILSDERAFKSKSPAMHNRVLRQRGIDGVYVPFSVEPDQIGEAIRGLKALKIAGANVTVPHKEAVRPHLDELSAEAAAIGAVNTIVRDRARLIGHNTDAAGFTDALAEAGFEAAGRTALVIGTGGAARAVLFSLGRMGPARMTLAGRNQARTTELAARTGASPASLESLPGQPLEAELVINCTSASSETESPELAGLARRLDLSGCRLIFDLNYGREVNFWQDLAWECGATFSDGLSMLSHQARRSFFLWTGLVVEAREFLAALEENP